MIRTVPRGFRRLAMIAAATLVGGLLSPTLAVPAAAADCADPMPYRAYANTDLLRLSALDLPGLNLGPAVDVRLSSTGASMNAETEVAAAAAARDVAANLLGLDLIGLLPIDGVGHTVYQQAPPTNEGPATATGPRLDLGVARVEISQSSAHARWHESMRCAQSIGTAGVAGTSLANAAILPGLGKRSLIWLPGNLSSQSEAGLTEQDGRVAAYATSAISLAEVRLFAGTRSEITVKVISQPSLRVSTTGAPNSHRVQYDTPVLEISGPGIGRERLDAPGTHIDLALGPTGLLGRLGLPLISGGAPAELLDDPAVEGLDTSGEVTDPALPAPEGLPAPEQLGGLPLLQDVLANVGELLDLSQLSVLRLSIGELRQQVEGDTVSASAASLRLQVLRWGNDDPAEPARAALDLGIGLLQAAANAPAVADPPMPSPDPDDDGDGGDGGELPITGTVTGLVATGGVLLTVLGGAIFLLSRTPLRRGRDRSTSG